MEAVNDDHLTTAKLLRSTVILPRTIAIHQMSTVVLAKIA
jgi:hypothetical protein